MSHKGDFRNSTELRLLGSYYGIICRPWLRRLRMYTHLSERSGGVALLRSERGYIDCRDQCRFRTATLMCFTSWCCAPIGGVQARCSWHDAQTDGGSFGVWWYRFYAAGLFCVAASTFSFVLFACLRLIFAHCVDVVTMSLIGVVYIG
jgi:hypothetical protein